MSIRIILLFVGSSDYRTVVGCMHGRPLLEPGTIKVDAAINFCREIKIEVPQAPSGEGSGERVSLPWPTRGSTRASSAHSAGSVAEPRPQTCFWRISGSETASMLYHKIKNVHFMVPVAICTFAEEVSAPLPMPGGTHALCPPPL